MPIIFKNSFLEEIDEPEDAPVPRSASVPSFALRWADAVDAEFEVDQFIEIKDGVLVLLYHLVRLYSFMYILHIRWHEFQAFGQRINSLLIFFDEAVRKANVVV